MLPVLKPFGVGLLTFLENEMKHDPLDFKHDMTRTEVFWRVSLLVSAIAVLLADLFIWRAS